MTIGLRAGDIAGSLRDAPLLRSTSNRVEHQVRSARITDVERLMSLGDTVPSEHAMSAPRVAGDLLGQPVHLLQASIPEDLIRSAGNEGCAAAESATPDDPADLARWECQGFGFAGPLLRRSVAAVGAAARCT